MFVLSSAIFLGIFCSLDVAIVADRRIMGGTTANLTQIPYQAVNNNKMVNCTDYAPMLQLSLEVRDFGGTHYMHICGAVIIDKEWALTAAHCVVGENHLRVRAGDINRKYGEIKYVKQHFVHEDFSKVTKDYDIALLKMETPFRFSSSVQRIRLAKKVPPTGTQATVSGWGRTNKDGQTVLMLQKPDVEILSSESCAEAYKLIKFNVTERMICAGSLQGDKGACKGDSGGPLVAKGKLIGIVSSGDNCKGKQRPGVYASVVNLSTWIKSVKNNISYSISEFNTHN